MIGYLQSIKHKFLHSKYHLQGPLCAFLLALTLVIFPSSVLRWAIHLRLVSQETGIDTEVLACVVLHESHGDPNAISTEGAIGLMQIRPLEGRPSRQELRDPMVNLRTGAEYLAKLIDRNNGNLYRALLDYNGGPYRTSTSWQTRQFALSVFDCIAYIEEHPELKALFALTPHPQSY